MLGQEEIILYLHLVPSTGFWKRNWSIIQNTTLKYNLYFWDGNSLDQKKCVSRLMHSSISHQK